MNVVVPLPFKLNPLANPLPFEIAPLIVMFAEPERESLTALGDAAAMVSPPRTIVLPAPLKVKVTPLVAAEVLFIEPIVIVVPVPNKLSVRLEAAVTVPEPRLRSLLAVFPIAPNVTVDELPKVILLFPAFTTAAPLVLLMTLLLELNENVPLPSALALLMFRVPPAPIETPPDAAELFPLKTKVPAFTDVRPV